MTDSQILGPEELREISQFRRALELSDGFAFHVIVADTKLVLDSALQRLGRNFTMVRPRPARELLVGEATSQILAQINSALATDEKPVLIDALVAERVPAWIFVFRRLNELRNSIEKHHSAPLVLALTPAGETVLGQQAPDLWSKRGSGMRLKDRRLLEESAAMPPIGSWEVLPPPKNAMEFEDLCFELFKEIWNDPGARRITGGKQVQRSLDIYGRTGDLRIGVQCRLSNLSPRDLEIAVERAKGFELPLDILIVASAGERDLTVEERARELSKTEGLMVRVLFWYLISYELLQRPALLARYSPQGTQGEISAGPGASAGAKIGALIGTMLLPSLSSFLSGYLGTYHRNTRLLGPNSAGTPNSVLRARSAHLAGKADEAHALFSQAEERQRLKFPDYPLLQSLSGFWYSDLLLDPAERAAGLRQSNADLSKLCQAVESRVSQTLEWAQLNRAPLLDLGLNGLTLARTLLYGEILAGKTASSTLTKEEVEQALTLLRAASAPEFVLQGLLTRAWLRQFEGDLKGASADLEEARSLAESATLPFGLADVAIYRARLFHDREALAEGRSLIEQQGYGRRRQEIADLEAASASW